MMKRPKDMSQGEITDLLKAIHSRIKSATSTLADAHLSFSLESELQSRIGKTRTESEIKKIKKALGIPEEKV